MAELTKERIIEDLKSSTQNSSGMFEISEETICALMSMITTQPSPVSVPDAMEMDDNFDSAFEHGKAVGWNACLAAMLQGGEPVQGWIPCSDRLPQEGYEPDGGAVCYLVWYKNEVDCGPQYGISNVFFLRKHWEKNYTHWMPLPAAPQQEAL